MRVSEHPQGDSVLIILNHSNVYADIQLRSPGRTWWLEIHLDLINIIEYSIIHIADRRIRDYLITECGTKLVSTDTNSR